MQRFQPILRRALSTKTPAPTAIATQAKNRPAPWSVHQEKKEVAMTGPRIELARWRSRIQDGRLECGGRFWEMGFWAVELLPSPLAAIELIKNVPIKSVAARRVACDGGGGALGHPKVFINLDDGHPVACGYCGQRFQIEHHHH
ncbi:zinc-finger domain-containing protein [Chytridium lagenaria]|nr:zinc-finger domain-containing protein [Chytridium lagenaria]